MEKKNKKSQADIRYLLANERTLLAWFRTSIALIAGGLVASHFSSNRNVQKLFSVLIIALGGIVAIIGYTRFRATDRAIRNNHAHHSGHFPAIQSAGVALVSIAFIFAILYSAH